MLWRIKFRLCSPSGLDATPHYQIAILRSRRIRVRACAIIQAQLSWPIWSLGQWTGLNPGCWTIGRRGRRGPARLSHSSSPSQIPEGCSLRRTTWFDLYVSQRHCLRPFLLPRLNSATLLADRRYVTSAALILHPTDFITRNGATRKWDRAAREMSSTASVTSPDMRQGLRRPASSPTPSSTLHRSRDCLPNRIACKLGAGAACRGRGRVLAGGRRNNNISAFWPSCKIYCNTEHGQAISMGTDQ